MGREIKLFKSEETQSRSEISAFLHQIADEIDKGTVTLRQGDNELRLEIPETAILEVQVEDEKKKRKGTQHSLELEIKWYDGSAESGLELG